MWQLLPTWRPKLGSNYTSTWVNWGVCPVLLYRHYVNSKWTWTPKSENRWLSGSPHRRVRRVYLRLFKNLWRVDHKTICFLFSVPRQKNVWPNVRQRYNLKLRNFKSCKFTTLSDMILKDTAPVHLHNQKRSSENTVVSFIRNRNKGVQVFFKKRRLMHNFDSLPYGFE